MDRGAQHQRAHRGDADGASDLLVGRPAVRPPKTYAARTRDTDLGLI